VRASHAPIRRDARIRSASLRRECAQPMSEPG